jgi:phenylacetate-CoA ligase
VSIPGLREDSVFFSTGGLRGFALRRKVRPLSLAADVLDSYRFISKWKPDLLWAPPSFFRALIRVCEERQQDVSFKVACTSGEMLDSSTRKLIGDRFHAEVFSLYGLADAGCVAWECPTHSGYHIDVDSLLTEFIRDGQSVAAGEAGELCVTNLYRKAAPVIRYLVGDIAIPLDADCSCGRGLPLLKGIQGRILDFILTEDGRQISPFTVMYTLEGIPGVEQYKVIQESDHSIQVLVKSREIKVEPVLQALRERCRALFGDMPLTIKPVDEIENARGRKFRVVESRLAK